MQIKIMNVAMGWTTRMDERECRVPAGRVNDPLAPGPEALSGRNRLVTASI